MRAIHDYTVCTSAHLQGKHAEAIEYQKETKDFSRHSDIETYR